VLGTGGAYLVMELVFGETLGRVIKRKGCVDPHMSAELFAQVLEGVKAAHQAGVIHRDLKPDNILISQGKDAQIQVRLLDFGLAKIRLPELADANGASMTAPGTVLGTIGYMSPEQLTGSAVDERSDLFSVGVMVVEALTGCRPFNGKNYHELLTSILHGAFHLPTDSPEAERLDAVLQNCMAKDRSDRFSSAAAMQRELIPAIREYRPLNSQQWTTSEAEDTLRF
jgi:serine/threonine protein kinase